MKKGTYIASTEMEGSVMFRIDRDAYTLRKGKDITVEIKSERAKVTFPASFMTLTLKGDAPVKSKSESKPAVAKKEIKEEAEVKTEVKVEEPKVEVKAEEKAPVKKPATRGRKKTVKIETEEK